MRILHYIPILKTGDLVSDDLRILVEAMKDMADVRMVTAKEDVMNTMNAFQPNIIHVHACWNHKAATFVKVAVETGYTVVISPHWGLEPYSMRHEQHIEKLLKSNLYQRRMIQRAAALLVTTESERTHLMKLGWKKRINVVRSSILDQLTTPEQQATETICFYQKVIDTRYFKLMTDMEKNAVRSLLCIGTSQESVQLLLSKEQQGDLQALLPEQWKRILLYADDEDIREITEKAIQRMQLNVPDIDTLSIDRYQTIHPKTKGTLDTSASREKAVRVTTREEKEICTICAMLLAAQQQYKQKTLSMRHVAELYEAIKYYDFDEEQFARIVKRLGIRKFTARMLQIVSDDLYLGEGFLPMPPLNDRGTQRLRSKLLH